MRRQTNRPALLRTRWSAVGAAVAITLGAGGLSMAQAAIDEGDRPVTITVAAERILDTRTDLGLSGRFADGAPRDLQVTGSVPTASGGSKTVVPADAVGVLVNVTVVTPTNDGFLSLRPQGATGDPTTSTVNFTPGSIEPNAATVDLNDGKIQIWVETSSDTGTADVLIDIVGYTIGHTHDDRYYTETESDAAVAAAVAPKADSADVYTKTQSDGRYYTDAEVDAIVTELEQAQSFAVSDFSDSSVTLTSAAQAIASVTVTAPVDGQVTVNSNAYPVVEAGRTASCYVSAGGVGTMPQWYQPATGVTNGNMAGTGLYDLSAGETETFEYWCWSPENLGDFIAYPSGLTAIFTPAP